MIVDVLLHFLGFSAFTYLVRIFCVVEALMGLKDLFARFPTELPMHAIAIVEKLSPRITDYDKAVRQTLLLLLRTTILPGLPQVSSQNYLHTEVFKGLGFRVYSLHHA